MDDYMFFQKVESLMVNDKLFCEQEISREVVAAAIAAAIMMYDLTRSLDA